MKTPATLLALSLLYAAPAFAADAEKKAEPAKKSDATKGEATSVNAAEVKFGPAPPDLPKGAELAGLHGAPGKPHPFTIRLKMPAGYKTPPHWHTKDEQLTILSGTFILHMGDTMDAPASNLTAGGYHFLPGKMHHAAETKGETILQLDGVGP